MNIGTEISNGHVLLAQRLPAIRKFMLIGSASYMPNEAKDVDFAVLLDEGQNAMRYVDNLAINGWDRCGEYDIDKGTWSSVRKGNINLMITHDLVFYGGYLKATEVCKALNLRDKDQRILVCMIVRDNMCAEGAQERLAYMHKVDDIPNFDKDDEL